MLARSLARPSASFFAVKGACLLCQASKLQQLLVRGKKGKVWAFKKAPITREREDEKWWARETADREAVAQQVRLGTRPPTKQQKEGLNQVRIDVKVMTGAYKSGIIKLLPYKANELLREFEKLGKAPKASDLKGICSRLRIDPDHLTGFCILLLRSKSTLDRRSGRDLLLCASSAGVPSASIRAVNSARHANQLSAVELIQPLKQIAKLAEGGKNVQAMVLQGLLNIKYKKRGEAAALFNKVLQTTKAKPKLSNTIFSRFARFVGIDLPTLDPNLDHSLPDELELGVVSAHIGLADLQTEWGTPEYNAEAAKENMEAAAFEYDDPYAYFALAGFAGGPGHENPENDNYTMKWFDYTRKAAASGNVESCYQLGKIYSWGREHFEDAVKSKRMEKKVMDEILSNPLFNTVSGLRALWNNGSENQRRIKRLQWAYSWHDVAYQRGNLKSYFEMAWIAWESADLQEKDESRNKAAEYENAIARERVSSLTILAYLLRKRSLLDDGTAKAIEDLSNLIWATPEAKAVEHLFLQYTVDGKPWGEIWNDNEIRLVKAKYGKKK